MHHPLSIFGVLLLCAGCFATSPWPNNATAHTIVTPAGTVVGSIINSVEYYRGIPYAHPPVGPLRLKPPVRLDTVDTTDATGLGPACPQMAGADVPSLFIEQVLANPDVAGPILLGSATGDVSEDCLTISVMRPQGTSVDAKLPVLFWIYGGGFEIGSSQPYNASVLLPRAVAQGKPVIFVAVNYRLGGFGFLGGKEWVADNIAAFGGDPAAVTIWGESAGSFSVFDQLALYNGDNSYKGVPLFQGAIMNSGSILPTEPVDGCKAQEVFDTVVRSAGCSNTDLGKLNCLRDLDYEAFLNATNSVPSFLSYNSLSLSYMPRPDGRIITSSPEVLAKEGRFAAVPLIIGGVEDEGTLFALFQANVTTKSNSVSYLKDIIFRSATSDDVAGLVDTYQEDLDSEQPYPEFHRLASVLGDFAFTLMRRIFLRSISPSVPAWSFIATWERKRTVMGTFHTSDLPRIFYGVKDADVAIQNRYIAFVHSLDPNQGLEGIPEGHRTFWPTWHDSRQILDFGIDSTGLINDDFRAGSSDYLQSHLEALRL